MCLKTQNSIKSAPPPQSPGRQRISQALIKNNGEKKQQQFYNPEKTAIHVTKPPLHVDFFFFWTEESISPSLARYDSQIIHGWITLFHHILVKICGVFILLFVRAPCQTMCGK